VASEVSKRLKRLSLWSMGSGAGCDAQYLFSMDILGDTSNQSMAAFTEYRLNFESGAFPAEEHVVRMKPDEWERFRLALPSE
jgi:3-methyl-2-oxobutanoate hydroxymethyltransferase